jgi:anti-sigma factor RsiW
MTPCDRKHEDILDFEDGELDVSRKKEVKRHLDECCDCKKLLSRIRAQRAALKRCASLKTQDTFFLLLQERIRRDLAGKRSAEYGSVFGQRRWIPASAFALVLVVAAGWILTRKTAETRSSVAITSSVPAPSARKTPAKVHYVIDDYQAPASAKTRAQASAAPATSDTLVQMATADTAALVKNFDALKGRLTPVSF